jgi:hypothetical protein
MSAEAVLHPGALLNQIASVIGEQADLHRPLIQIVLAWRCRRLLAGARGGEAELDAGEEELAALRQLPLLGFPSVRLVF